MEPLRDTVRCLAVYLMVVSLLGTTTQIWNFIGLLHERVPCINGTDCSGRNATGQVGQMGEIRQKNSDWNNGFRVYMKLVYEYTFPVIISTSLKSGPMQVQRKLYEEISTAEFFATLLPSFFLLKGSLKVNYSNCKFWYYTQVGSLLLTCLKLVLVTLLDLWDAATNGVLIAVLLGLSQLWLVQSFMEKLEREAKNQRQTRFVSQLLALNDFESGLDYDYDCKVVEESSSDITSNKVNSKINVGKLLNSVNVISNKILHR